MNKKEKIIGDMLNHIISTTVNGTNDSDQHLLTLFGIALEIKAKKILELGVRDGHTTIPLLLAAVITEGLLTSVDINNTTFTTPAEVRENHKFIMSDAIKFLQNCVDNNTKYDLIFIDDWHTYEHVKKELELISKISDYSTVILLHDLMCSTAPHYFHPSLPSYDGGEWEGGGPFKAVYELDINEWEWATIPVNNGLTLLRKRSDCIVK